MEVEIVQRLQQIQHRILHACAAAGRDPAQLRLLLATKTVAVPSIAVALAAGQRLIGENRVQELSAKAADLDALRAQHDFEVHFIGRLQSNKINELLRSNVSCLHSLDRFALAQKLNARLLAQGRTLAVLLQVNVSGEASKAGVAPQEVVDFARRMGDLPALQVCGLMTIGLNSDDAAAICAGFRQLRELGAEIWAQGWPHLAAVPELSMGMSHDLEHAIAEGATILRVGSAVFGQRSAPA